jgi:hypothetical protein
MDMKISVYFLDGYSKSHPSKSLDTKGKVGNLQEGRKSSRR